VIAEADSFPRAFAVWFKDLQRWSVGSFQISNWSWPKNEIKKLSFAVERVINPINKTEFGLMPEHFVTVKFSGVIQPRKLHGKSDFKGGLFLAHAGDIIYSKIDVRNGAIGIIPKSFPVVAVTSEFPVYRIRKEVAISEYIQLLFRTNHFRQIINSMISGTSGRKRVQPSELENIEIPVPSIAKQTAIVRHWRNAQNRISAALARIEETNAQIEARFLVDLGFQLTQKTDLPRFFGVWWRDFNRWGVSYNQQRLTGLDISQGKFPVVELRSIIDFVQYGTSEKANSVGNGVRIIRMNNIVGGTLSLSKLKYVQLSEGDISRLLLEEGDILFNRTNSKELVGKCAVFEEAGEFVFASYLIRLRVDRTRANPAFIAYALNSPIGRQQIDAISRQIIGQANVNSEELAGLRLPLPPLSVQDRIVRWIKREQAKTSSDAADAKRRETEMTRNLELMILGKLQPN